MAEVELVRRAPRLASDRFWLQERGIMASVAWGYQNLVGRRLYDRSQAVRSTEAKA
ncbi:hypothetical protein MAUB1S_00890 [Mycolicibacterium aubagnense]